MERLTAKLAELEAQRDRIKRYNASCRKGAPDLSLLDDAQRESHEGTMRVAAWQCKGGAFPAYALSNLGGTITATRKRLEEIQRKAAREARYAHVVGILIRAWS